MDKGPSVNIDVFLETILVRLGGGGGGGLSHVRV